MKKSIYFLMILFIIYTLDVIDRNNAMLRAFFISKKLDKFYNEKGKYPYDLADVSEIFNKIDYSSLTSCHRWDKDIPGTGYCYYSIFGKNGYFIQVSSYSNYIILSSSGNYCFGYECTIKE